MVLVDKKAFLKMLRDENDRAVQIIKILKAESGMQNVNYHLVKEVILLNGNPQLKITIKEFPISRFSKEFDETQDEIYRDFTFDNLDDEATSNE